MDSETTVRDVALDAVAALDMYQGDFGAENVTIEEVLQNGRSDTFSVRLSDGSLYRFEVEQIA